MRYKHRSLLLALAVALIGLLTSCDLDKSGLPGYAAPQIAVDPQGPMCPGEPVILRWNAGLPIEDCVPDGRLVYPGSCAIVFLTSDDPALDTRIDPWTLMGDMTLRPRRTTEFTLEKRFEKNSIWTDSMTSSVSLPMWPAGGEVPSWQDWTLPGSCSGSRPVWVGLNLRTAYGDCTRIGNICNTDRHPVTLIDDLGGSIRLNPGECTDQYYGTLGDLRPALAVIVDLSLDPTRYCQSSAVAGSASEPPDVTLAVGVSCLDYDAESGGCLGRVSLPLESDSLGDDDTRLQFPCGDGICQPEAGEDSQICPQDCGSEVGPDVSLPVGPVAAGIFLTIKNDSLCWAGPGGQYPVISTVVEGIQVEILGRGELTGWLIIDNPRFPGVACWLPEANLDVDPALDLSELDVIPVPPLPEPTNTPAPPIAPSKLVVSNEICSQTEYTVTLSWIDNANNEDGYRVYYNGTLIATLAPNTTSYQYSVPSSSAAVYAVEAFNAAGASARPMVNEDGCLA